MVLIFGGAYQGKLDFAKELSSGKNSVYRCPFEEIPDFSADIIDGYHAAVLALIRSGIDPCAYTSEHLGDFAQKVIICDDISSGVVPLDPEMRAWREAVGRCMGILSGNADSVYRVFCGIVTQIK